MHELFSSKWFFLSLVEYTLCLCPAKIGKNLKKFLFFLNLSFVISLFKSRELFPGHLSFFCVIFISLFTILLMSYFYYIVVTDFSYNWNKILLITNDGSFQYYATIVAWFIHYSLILLSFFIIFFILPYIFLN